MATGVPGLDELLQGGLPAERMYLVEGGPGTGKTTLGLQFLREGAARGEPVLFVSLLQTRTELNDTANAHDWSLDGITAFELPQNVQEASEAEQTVFNPGEIELEEATDAIVEAIEKHQPRRVVLDSVSELDVVVDSPYQLRRQLIKLRRALSSIACTAILTAAKTVVQELPIIQTMVHGSIALRREAPPYGELQRTMEVEKMRGIDFEGGYHDFVIRTGGVAVFPRLRGDGEDVEFEPTRVASGNERLDAMFGGGLEAGSACLVMGTSGAGKSTLTSLYTTAVAERGEFASVYCFDESRETYLRRSQGLQLGIGDYVERGLVELRQYEVGGLTPGEFMQHIRDDVEQRSTKLVVIDSFTGYLNLMLHRDALVAKLGGLLRFLSGRGVLTLLTANVERMQDWPRTDVDASYLADTVVLMRHFEAMGAMRYCIAVLKKRHGEHERTVREFEFAPGGFRVGPPLKDFTGVLSGTPEYVGDGASLFDHDGDNQRE